MSDRTTRPVAALAALAAGACLLAMAELHLPGLRATIGSGWRRWL